MNLSDFHYDFPEELIAQHPLPNRDDSRLMVLHRSQTSWEHQSIQDLPQYLTKKDLLVFNNTKVFAARFFGETAKRPIEVLLLEQTETGQWLCLGRGLKKIPLGEKIQFSEHLSGCFTQHRGDRSLLKLEGPTVEETMEQIGFPPLPPYIVRRTMADYSKEDRERYQAIFAEKMGSCAAPTASLHFSEKLISEIKKCGASTTFVTLHVSTDTFQPIRVESLENHKMHGEFFEVPKEAQEKIRETKSNGGRIIAVGTTVARALESDWSQTRTDIFIKPGFSFRRVDALLTNFHQPDSTLICLVSALVGREFLLKAYQEAIQKQYRLFSFGDAMLIL